MPGEEKKEKRADTASEAAHKSRGRSHDKRVKERSGKEVGGWEFTRRLEDAEKR